jgi:hypothetical protein
VGQPRSYADAGLDSGRKRLTIGHDLDRKASGSAPDRVKIAQAVSLVRVPWQ